MDKEKEVIEAIKNADLRIERIRKEFWKGLEEKLGKEETQEIRVAQDKLIDSMVKWSVKINKLREELTHMRR